MKFSRAWLFVLAACNFDPPNPAAGGDGGIDAPDIDAPPGNDDRHVLLTEIATIGSSGEAEFVEILNPTTRTIDLSNYYLSDDQEYWKLPGNVTDPIQLNDSDFLVKFPAGTMMPPGAVFVIAVNGVDYAATHNGAQLDFTILVDGQGSTAMDAVVPTPGAMAERFTNSGEMIVLFEWDGQSDLVHDVDLYVHGDDVSEDNKPIAKSDVDGPDAGTTASSYKTDALTFTAMPRDMLLDESYKRIASEGNEGTNGNGITQHDETSEKTGTTWAISSGVTPGIVPPGL